MKDHRFAVLATRLGAMFAVLALLCPAQIPDKRRVLSNQTVPKTQPKPISPASPARAAGARLPETKAPAKPHSTPSSSASSVAGPGKSDQSRSTGVVHRPTQPDPRLNKFNNGRSTWRIPDGSVVHHGDHSFEVVSPRGKYVVQNDVLRRVERNNRIVEFDQKGILASISSRSHDYHAEFINGKARDIKYPNGLHVVNLPHVQYLEQPYRKKDQGFMTRTYFQDGNEITRNYRVEGERLRYMPPVAFSPAYLDWAVKPWPLRVTYDWQIAEAPWAAHYANYFTPSATYTSVALWATDFIISRYLERAYLEERREGHMEPTTGSFPFEEAARARLATNITDQTRAHQSLSSGKNVEPWITQIPKYYLVFGRVSAGTSDKGPCEVSDGDMLESLDPAKGTVAVHRAKLSSCPSGFTFNLTAWQLAEFEIHFREEADHALSLAPSRLGAIGQVPQPPPPDLKSRPIEPLPGRWTDIPNSPINPQPESAKTAPKDKGPEEKPAPPSAPLDHPTTAGPDVHPPSPKVIKPRPPASARPAFDQALKNAQDEEETLDALRQSTDVKRGSK